MAFTYNKYEESDALRQARANADAAAQYKESQRVTDAYKAYQQNQANKVSVNDWTGGTYGQNLQNTINKINNREKFSYDINGDALYQQYKDQYVNLGQMAMKDTMGQAAALTGGYGSSYGQAVGQQQYDAAV